jgi:CheY-like chemotaxis protein
MCLFLIRDSLTWKEGAVTARILLIEDDSELRLVLERLLERCGHSVASASNGREGLKRFRTANVDLVITDIFMPVQEGIETICELRRHRPDTKIIAISGGGPLGVTDHLVNAEKLGATFTLTKPFRSEDILQAVEFVVGRPRPRP